ncbi:MAG: ATP-binding cassette domain-containing protein, partial [Acidimicrobiaceae bacterium]|nr:ATP-binding cassette domain-containing protein [Acidimicrobiaceae bacterium]
MTGPLLSVEGLRTHFFVDAGVVKAVDGVSFEIRRGEVVGLVGESGCGKTVTSLSIAGLIEPPGRIVDGSVRFDGTELVGAPERVLNSVRGPRIAMIFQQAPASLAPV